MSDIYESPLVTRYASKEMASLFSMQKRIETWRRLWLELARAEHALGLPITDGQINDLQAHLTDIDFACAEQREKEVRHDVMAHIYAYGKAAPSAAGILHLGATSCYVTDNGDLILYREAFLLLRRRLTALLRALAGFADRWKALPTLGYTHYQPAQLVTVGKRATLWMQELVYDLEELDFVAEHLRPLGCKGTTGTQASFLELFHGDEEKVFELDRRIVSAMGFREAAAVSGQTYSRKQDARMLNALAQIGASAQKFATDLRLLQHEKEIEEPFETSQVGSSAMPYKRNPMRAERMTGLARYLIGNAQNALTTAAEQWLERSLDDSANRRLSMADGFLCADGLLMLYENVTSNLTVNPKVIDRHLQVEMPFIASENLLMQAVERGGNRQQLHEKIRVAAMAAGRRVKQEGAECDLLDRLAADPDFPMTGEEIRQQLDPAAYTGMAQKQTEVFLDTVIKETLEKYTDLPEADGEIRL